MILREMRDDEIDRIAEVDRSEVVEAEFVVTADEVDLQVLAKRVVLDEPSRVPRWSQEGIRSRSEAWTGVLRSGGWMCGAFDEKRLLGFIILGHKRSDDSSELVALFVDADHRREGVGAALLNQALRWCAEQQVKSLFLYSNPTDSAISFYLKHGFSIQGLISKEIVSSLPGDIVMARAIEATIMSG